MTDFDPTTATWHTSSYSGGNGGNCIEAALGCPGVVPVRDSKDRRGPVLTFTPEAFTAFLRAVRAGEFRTP
jgi:hypothetical protein